MRRTTLTASLVALALLATGTVSSEALAQSSRGDGATLRQRLDDGQSRRPDARKPTGQGRSDVAREIRRQRMIDQNRIQATQPRSVPVLPKRNSSSVVVTQ